MFRAFSFLVGIFTGVLLSALVIRSSSGLRLLRTVGDSVLRASGTLMECTREVKDAKGRS
ncbi:hypothetical protein [Tropheryma whipplei]|uniref:hypothetical protein n=1 Tax=Tropheryma whipplei TaxID=2039 RepID=UPI0004B1A5A6|nr:hypothetical protein [Tropheryma whipplei]MCO8182362.1 hypothetical protein [Tropheryma whipplei]